MKLLNSILICGLFLSFSSCKQDSDPNPDDNPGNGTEKIYWDRSDLVHHGLKGKVKKITYPNGDCNEYNADGNIIASKSDCGYENIQTKTYEYSKGSLVKMKSNGLDECIYEYDSHGRYIPPLLFHLHEAGFSQTKALVKGLKSISYPKRSKEDYLFEGDKLRIIYTRLDTEPVERDTSYVEYKGNYPVKSEGVWDFFRDISYEANGMFSSYTEGFFGGEGEGKYVRTIRTYKFKKDDDYLMWESAKYKDLELEEWKEISITRTFDEKKNLIGEVEIDGTNNDSRTIEYVYDAKGNWTKKTVKYNEDNSYETVRSIEYWE